MSAAMGKQVALVTGGGRGMGRAMALRLAREGAAVVVVSRSKPQLDAVVAEIEAAGGQGLAIAADVTDKDAVDRAVAAAADRFGPVTLLVNNAGVPGPLGPIGDVDPLKWWDAQRVHVLGALLFMNAVVPGMRTAGGGRIINICSQAGTFVAPNYSSYCVAKATLLRLTEHVDAEGRPHNVRAFGIQPGTIITELSRETLSDPGARKWAGPLVDLLESITPEQSAAAEEKLQDFISDLARGRFDALSGRYLDVDWDLEAKLREAKD